MKTKLERLDPTSLLSNPRATLPAWKKYETLVMLAYNAFPSSYIWEPTGMMPSTVGTRVRDAIRGCLAFEHPIAEQYNVTHSDLRTWFGEIIVKWDHDSVYIGPPDRIAEALKGTGNSTTPTTGFRFVSLSFEEISAFMLLIGNGRLQGPVLVNTPPDISLVPERENVETMVRPDGSLLIL